MLNRYILMHRFIEVMRDLYIAGLDFPINYEELMLNFVGLDVRYLDWDETLSLLDFWIEQEGGNDANKN